MSENQRLKKVKNHYGYNQKDFSNEIGIAQAKISKIERGVQELQLDVALAISSKFNIKIEWLSGLEGNDDNIIFKNDEPSTEELDRLRKELEQERIARQAEIVKRIEVQDELLQYQREKIKQSELKSRVEVPIT